MLFEPLWEMVQRRRRLLLRWEPASFGIAEQLQPAVRVALLRALIISQAFVSLHCVLSIK